MQTTNQKTIKIKDSNMELLRIVAMLLVFIVHASFLSLGEPTSSDFHINLISTFMRIFSESIAIVCVNVFILISGWYGIKMKLSRLLAFIFQVYFLNMIAYCVLSPLGMAESISIISWFQLYNHYWFINAYIVLYILTPVLNAFIDKANKKQIGLFLIVFFCIQIIIRSGFAGGYSALSFIGLYILARYMRLYPTKYTQQSKFIYLATYFVATIATTIIALLLVIRESDVSRIYYYNSPLVIFASVCLFLFFSKVSVRSKIINWIAVSCFAAYVIHCSPIFFSVYLSTIKEWFNNETGLVFISYTALWIACVFIVSILLDKIRIWVWNTITSFVP